MIEALEELRQFVIANELPRTDLALFGVRCPYCGKSDRIRKLEAPDDLKTYIQAQDWIVYQNLWENVRQPGGWPGVCRFCQNILHLTDSGQAVAIGE